ncbi:hypothetical protein D3Z62_29370 [Lachnospiraceae bacterium]|nr:hypothetical protein [Lachnospiraceae bacterium]
MVVSNVAYTKNEWVKEAETIKPLQESNVTKLLQGKCLPEEKRMDSIALHLDENTPHILTAPKPKKEDCVIVLKNEYFLSDFDQYINIFEQYAKGEISTYDFHGYIAGAGRAVSWALDRSLTYCVSLFRGAYNLVDEMKENLKNGVANTLENLKTKFRIEGKEFTYKEVSAIHKTGNYLQEVIGGNNPCGYDDYMKMGMARVYAYKPELGLTKDQADILSNAVERRIEQKLEKNKEWIEIALSEEQNSRWKGYYIGGSLAVASNTQIISEIMKAFSEMNPTDNRSVEKAVNRFQELLKPWNERCAEYIATQLPGYARGYVQEKAKDLGKLFYSYWNWNP